MTSSTDSEDDVLTKSIFKNQKRTNRRPQLREEEVFFFAGFNTNIVIASDDSCLPPEAAKLKSSYCRDFDFNLGTISFSTPRESNKKETFAEDNKDEFRCAVLPLDKVLKKFHNPMYFAKLLSRRAIKYINTWNKEVSIKDPNKRSSFDSAFSLIEEERKVRGSSKIDRADYQLIIQSYLFTQETNALVKPVIELDNLR